MSRLIKVIRGNIIAGILLIIPLALTIWLFIGLFGKIDSALPALFHMIFPGLPADKWGIRGVGFIAILFIAYFTGLAAKNYFGMKIIQAGNAIISNIPFLNKIYLGIQQIIDAVVSGNKKLFQKAVLIEYPKVDSYCIAFVTSQTTGEIPDKTSQKMLSIFVPTTPNPTSGFLLFIPESKVIDLDMSVETAVKLVMSAGMVNSDQLRKTQSLYSDVKVQNPLKHFIEKYIRHKNTSNIDPRD